MGGAKAGAFAYSFGRMRSKYRFNQIKISPITPSQKPKKGHRQKARADNGRKKNLKSSRPPNSTQSGKSDIHIDAWLEQRQKSAGPLFPANLLLETCFSFARFSWHIASEPWSMGAAR